MGPETKTGLIFLVALISFSAVVDLYHVDGAPFPSLKSALQQEQTRISEILNSLINTPNFDKCTAPGAKIPITVKALIDDVVNKLIDIKSKIKCEESTDKPTTTTTTTTTTTPKKMKQCQTQENEEVVCIEAVEDGDVTIVKIIKNNKVIKETKLPAPITTVMETQIDKLLPTTEPVTKKVTERKVTLPNGDVIEVEVIEEDDTTTVVTKKNGDVISEKPTKGKPVSIIEEVISKYIPEEPKGKPTTTTTTTPTTTTTTTPTTTTPKKVRQCRTSSNGDIICIEVVEDNEITIINIIRNDKMVKQTKVPVPIQTVLETSFDKFFPTGEPVSKKVTTRRVTLPNGDIIEVTVIEEDDTTTVITKKNGEVVSKKPTKGNPVSIIEEEIRKYIPKEPTDKPDTSTSTSTSTTSTTTKRAKKCVQPNDEDIVCIEVVQEDDKIIVTTKKNGKPIKTEEVTGDVPDILRKEIKKYLPDGEEPQVTGPKGKPTGRETTRIRCVIINNQDKVCVEITETDDKVTVITRKNDKVVDTKTVPPGDVEEIVTETIKKYTTTRPDDKAPNDKPRSRKTTECVTVNNQYTICSEITTENDRITSIVTKKDGKVINPDDQPSEIQEIITRITRKYTSGGKVPVTPKTTRRTTKCVTLSNGDVICVETTEYPDKTIVQTIKNNKVIDENETNETVTEVIDQLLRKYTKTPSGKKPPVKKAKKCRVVDSGETVCVEIDEEDETLTVITTKNNEVISRKTTTGNIDDVLENEFTKYITTVATEQSVVRKKTKCMTKSNGETICVEVVEENNKLTVTVKKNGVIINTRVTKGNLVQVIDDELKQYVGEIGGTQPGQSKFIAKCGGAPDGDEFCVEITEENNIYRVVIKKNGVTTNSFTRDTSQSITTVLEQEFSKIMTLMTTAVERKTTATKNMCKKYGNGDRVCVKVMETDGIKTVETTKNDSLVRSRKSKDSFADIFKKEFDDFKS